MINKELKKLKKQDLANIIEQFVLNPKFIKTSLYHSINIGSKQLFLMLIDCIENRFTYLFEKDNLDLRRCLLIACTHENEWFFDQVIALWKRIEESEREDITTGCLAACLTRNNMHFYKKLVAEGADTHYNRWYSLSHVVAFDNIEFLTYLFKELHYEKINSDSWYPLKYAIEIQKSMESAKYMFSIQCDLPKDMGSKHTRTKEHIKFLEYVGTPTLQHMLFQSNLKEDYRKLIEDYLKEKVTNEGKQRTSSD